MKKSRIIFWVGLVILLSVLVGCNQTQEEVHERSLSPSVIDNNEIVINEITDMSFTKLLAESKVIEKEDLPSELKHIAEAVMPAKLEMITAIYTKSDYMSEEFDVLHDYSFLFSDDLAINIIVKASTEDVPLRDYFFNSEKIASKIEGVEVTISGFEDRFIAQFKNGEFSFDVETTGISAKQLVDVIQKIIG